MSTSVLLEEGLLTVRGDTDAANKISLSVARNGTDLAVKDARGVVQRVVLAEVQRIEIRGGLLRDTIAVSPKVMIDAAIYGDAGDDTLVAGGGVDVIYGGTGNDKVKLSYTDSSVDFDGANRVIRTGRPTIARAIQSVSSVTSADLINGYNRPASTVIPTTPAELAEDEGADESAPAPVTGAQASTAPAVVNGLTLIDAVDNNALSELTNGMTINLAKLAHREINVRADVAGGVGSVKFGLDANARYAVENGAPFAMASNNGSDYHAWTPSVGTHTIKATAYSGDNATGKASVTKTITFKVIDDASRPATSAPAITAPAVNGLTLINATTNKAIGALANGATIDLNDVRNLSIKAEVSANTKSVRFGYDNNSNYRVENYAPFAFNGDGSKGTDYYAWVPTVGTHTVIATAYTKSSAGGTASTQYKVTFTVVDTRNISTPATGNTGIGNTGGNDTTGGNTTGGNTSGGNTGGGNTGTPVEATPATGNNKAPIVTFINPTDGSEQAYPGHYVIRAAASDTDGSVAKVEFFVNGQLLDATTDAPYSTAWYNVAAGQYTLTARATDDDGASKVTTINVTISPPVVDDVFYVSPSGSNGNSGSASSPFQSISYAASLAGAGDTIIVLPGTYRETVKIKSNGTADAPITIKAQTPGTVVIDGSTPLGDWSRDGSNGNVYSTEWAKDFFFNGGTSRYNYADKVNGYAEQFIYQGNALKQVMSKADLSAGEFYVDWAANKVHVWLPNSDDPRAAGNTVYGSNRELLMGAASKDTGKYVTIDGLTFRHAANFAQAPAVKTTDGWVIKNTTIEKVGAVALGVYGKDNFVYNTRLLNNGQEGIMGGAVNALLVDNEIAGNNYKNYRISWEAGGGKLTRTQGLYMLNLHAHHNNGPGMWLDVYNTDYVFKGGYYHHNIAKTTYEGMGLMLEISDGKGRVEGISFYGNSGAGLSICEVSNVVVKGNFFANRLEIRNMEGRTYTAHDIKIENNSFKRAAITTSIGKWTTNIFRDYRITTNSNTFDNGGADIYQINGVKLKTVEAVKSRFGVEANGILAAVSMPLAA
jgi:hypothetical protein